MQELKPYGDLTVLNKCRDLLDTVGRDMLERIGHSYLDLLETSSAIYEVDGSYATALFTSSYCKFLDRTSRNMCATEDDREALESGKWLCHESCWSDASRRSIETGNPYDLRPCKGGINIYAVPIKAGEKIIGSINFGYGNPPTDEKTIDELTEQFKVNRDDLLRVAGEYRPRPDYIIEAAKRHLHLAAEFIGEIYLRKKAEESLQESVRKYKTILDSSLVGFVRSNVKGDILYVNDALVRMYEFDSKEEFIATRAQVRYKNPEKRAAMIEELKKKGKVENYEIEMITKKGKPINVVTSVIFEGDAITGVVIDNTERKKAEEALRKSNERFDLAVKGTNDGIWDWDIETNTNYFSPRFLELLDYGPGELAHELTTFEFLLHPEDRAWVFDRVRQHLEDKVPYNVEYRMRTKNGEYKWFQARGEAIRDQSGKPFRMAGSITDITGRKKAEELLKKTAEELKRSNEELQQFAYIASHDLQEPLRMITSYMQLIEQRYKNKLDKDADEFIAFAVDGANRLKEMINGLLDYSHVKTHGKPFTSVNCETVLENALADLRIAIEANKAVITHDPLPVIAADEAQFSQVFQNLLRNAIKFRKKEEPPHIHVSGKQEGGEWVFSFRDNGIGIEPQYKDRLFIMFSRLHGRGEYPGTGIGLAVCKRIVERHGGRIWVESEYGKESTFYFTISVSEQAGTNKGGEEV